MSISLKTLLVVGLLFASVAADDGKCRALVLAATTDRGSYHVGALQGLLENAKDPSDFAYDIVTGTSVGALNAALFAQYPKGQEKEATEALNDFWTTVEREEVYSYWGGGYVEGLLFKTSLVDSSPFKSYLLRNLNVPFKRKMVIGASNADTGNFDTFDETTLTNTITAAEAIMASGALPLYFPYVSFNSSTYLDGSLIMGADFADAVNRCKEIVGDESNIIVDLITTHGGVLENVDANDYNTLQVLVRFLEIYLFSWENFQYYLARLDYPDVTFRYFVKPTTILPGSFNPLSFDSKNIQADIAAGAKDALDILKTAEEYGNAPELIEKAVDWLDRNMGVFSHAKETIRELNNKQKH